MNIKEKLKHHRKAQDKYSAKYPKRVLQTQKIYREKHREKARKIANNSYKNYSGRIIQQKRRNKRMTILKVNGCAICGYNKCESALVFHHVNPKNKKFPLSKATMSRNPDSIIREVNKCTLLCSNCHREVHERERKRGNEI